MRNRPVTFTPAAARRIASAVSRVENGRQVTPGRKLKYMADEGGSALRLCETTAVWDPGATQELNVVGGAEGETLEATNAIGRVESGKKVLVGQNVDDGLWYMVNAEMIYRDVITGVELESDKILFTRKRIWTIEDQTEIDPIELPIESCT